MMEQPIIFDGHPGFGDDEYLAYLGENPNGSVANIPRQDREFAHFSIKVHRASCPDARRNIPDGSRTAWTQLKACSPSHEGLLAYLAREYPNNRVEHCQSTSHGGCSHFWTPEGQGR
jgi:hypothetical protein